MKNIKFSTKDISKAHGIPLATLTYNIRKLGFDKICNKYQFTAEESNFVVSHIKKKTDSVEVIYVTRTWLIFESKLNHLTLKQL